MEFIILIILVGVLIAIWSDDTGGCGCAVLIVAVVIGLARGATKHEAEKKSYTAVVHNTDDSEQSYDVKSYETKDGTMTLTLKDGTKVFVPITNITIKEHTDESTTETTVETTVETTESK